jgi:dGTPase
LDWFLKILPWVFNQIGKDSIDTSKYNTTKEDHQLLRALAIGSLIDAVKVFIDNEEAILKGKFPLL